MAEIKKLNYEIGADKSTITIATQNLPKGIKLKKALVTLKSGTTLSVNDAYNVKTIIDAKTILLDTIHSITSGDIIRINVTDELQNVLESKQALTLYFEKVNTSSSDLSFTKPSDDERGSYSSDVEYISKAEYIANGTSHSIDLGTAGQASINLNTGTLSIVHQDVQSDNNVLPLSISHVYNSFGTKLPSDDSISNYYGDGWKLNLEQYLVEKTISVSLDNGESKEQPTGEYEYFDENGKKQIIVEKYYYTTANEIGGKEKHYVERTDPKLSMNLDGELQYNKGTDTAPNIVPIETELEAPSGLKLVTKKADVKGANLVDAEPDELLQLREQLKQYTLSKKSIDNNIKSNKEQLCYMALAKKAFVDQIAIQIDSINNNEKDLNYQIDNRDLLYSASKQGIRGTQYVDYGKKYLAENNNDIANPNIKHLISYGLGNYFLSIPSVNMTNEDYEEGEGDTGSKTLLQHDISYVINYCVNQKELEYTWGPQNNVQISWNNLDDVQDCLILRQKLVLDKNNNFYNTSIDQDDIKVFLNSYLGNQVVDDLKLTETVSNLFNENNINNSYTLTLGSKDILSLDIQMQSLIDNILLSQEQLEDYVKNIAKLNNQIHAYERQIPQFYLYNDSVIYGFSPIITEKLGDNSQSSGTETASANSAENETSEIEYTTIPHIYRLNYIADTYENSIVINYEKNTNKIENIIDSQDNLITFEYKTVKTDNNTEENHIIITDAQDKQITFILQVDRLAKVKYNDGTISQYIYDSNGKLVAAVGANGIGARFDYYKNKVNAVREISALSSIQNGKAEFKDIQFSYNDLDAFDYSEHFINIRYENCDSTKISSLKKTTQNSETTTEVLKSLTYVFDNNGRVRTVYENSFVEKTLNDDNESEDDKNGNPNISPVVKSLDYVANKKQISVEPLLNSKNYMDDVCFKGNAIMQVPANYFGNGLLEGDEIYCGDDIYCESYPVHMDFHSYTTADTDFNQFLTVSTTHLTEINNLITNATNPQTRFVLGGWAKADSAFVFNPDNDGNINDFPDYIKNRKFELRAEITYTDTTTATFKKCFDWLNTEWQYCAVPIEFDKSREISSITCYFDYSNNTVTEDIPAYFTDFSLKEASYEERTYNNKLLTEVISSHSKWKQVCEYDDNDKLTKLYYYDTTNSTAEPLVNEFYYNKNGKLFKTIDYKGIVTEKVFNENGIEVQTKKYHKDNPAEIMYTEQKLGEKGEVLADYNELGEEINSYEYVAGTGIVSTVADKQGNKTAYGYDTKNGTLLQMSSDVDGVPNTNTYGYTLNFLTKVSHNDFDITYDYDSRGRISKIKVAGGDYLTFNYSEDGINSISTATYSNSQSFKTVTDKNGNVIEVYYRPELDIPSTAEGLETPDYQLILQNVYDTHGNLIAVNDYVTNSTTEYTLDKFGNTTLQADTQHGVSVQKENTFDADNNNTGIKYTIGTDTQNYTYSYDTTKPESVLNGVTLPTSAVQSIKNDNLGRTKEIVLSNTVNNETKTNTRLFHYLKNGDHTSNLVSSIWFGDDNKYLDNLKYKYDEKGNITEVYENSILVARYKYDSLSRLVREDNFPLRKTTTWEYDAGGNIFNRKEYTYTLNDDLSKYVDESLLNDNETNNNTYNTFKTIPYSYANSGIRDRLIGYGSKPTEQNKQFEYDAIGNPKIYRGKTFKWSHGRLLDAIGIGSDENFVQQHSYTYNASGIRTSKTMTIPLKQVEGPAVNSPMTLDYFLDGNKIISQQDVANKMFFIYGVDGIAGFSIQYNNTEVTYYYKKNLQGDIIGLYNSAMALIAKYEYDAWGNHIVKYLDSSGNFVATESDFCYNDISNINRFIANKNPFRYRGYYYDFETGLYYLNSRYYDPEIGRFINVDNINIINALKYYNNGVNLFSYCLNNPISFIDNLGNYPVQNYQIIKTLIAKDFNLTGNTASMYYRKHLVNNFFVRFLIGDISITQIVNLQENNNLFYTSTSIGNEGTSYGAGMNLGNLLGIEFVGNIGNDWVNSSIGVNLQITSFINIGASIGITGLGFSIGFNNGNSTTQLDINIGWGSIAAAAVTFAGIAAIPIPGMRIVGAIASFFVLLFT